MPVNFLIFLSCFRKYCSYHKSKIPERGTKCLDRFNAGVSLWIDHYFRAVRIKAGKAFGVKARGTGGQTGAIPYDMKNVLTWLRQLCLEKYSRRIVYYKARVEALSQSHASQGREDIADIVEVQTVPGTPLDILKEPNVKTLAEKIHAELLRVR